MDTGSLVFSIIIISVLFLIIYLPILNRKERKKRIYEKYGHTDIAEKIINGTVWVGETSEQLLDSIGQPVDIDERVLKTKKKETWKYHQKTANRYGLKIIVENGIVVGWDEKM
ncbi:MAG: DUF2845 domain-containing protein [Candidatus Ratteibacteria bacterium]|nr:DUF2845 domain-containing protein [Candidatus Ratteibacteria bacterium]